MTSPTTFGRNTFKGMEQAGWHSAAAFDAVICPFGLLHFPEAETALAEDHRVLKPGGRYAFTVWCTPRKVKFFSIVIGAIQSHGRIDAPLPPSPFRFSDHEECRKVLAQAGFVEAEVTEIPLGFEIAAGDILDFVYRITVRTVMLLEARSEADRETIHRAMVEEAETLAVDGRLEFAMPAVLAAARKP